jgi:hypothetical protein
VSVVNFHCETEPANLLQYIVLSCAGRGLYDGLITRPEESYRVSCMCDHRNPKKRPYVSSLERQENEWLNKKLGDNHYNSELGGVLDLWMTRNSLNDVKVKQYLNTPMEAYGERRYSSYSFTTSALDGGEWSASRPGRALPPGKGPPVPIVQESGWVPETVWTHRQDGKSFCLCPGSNLDRPVVQSVARHYTDWATVVASDLIIQNVRKEKQPMNNVYIIIIHCFSFCFNNH